MYNLVHRKVPQFTSPLKMVELQLPRYASYSTPCFDIQDLVTMQAHGIFVLHLPGPVSPSDSHPPPLTISRIPYFGDPENLPSISCLQMTDTGLFINWNPSNYVYIRGDNAKFNESLSDSPHSFFGKGSS